MNTGFRYKARSAASLFLAVIAAVVLSLVISSSAQAVTLVTPSKKTTPTTSTTSPTISVPKTSIPKAWSPAISGGTGLDKGYTSLASSMVSYWATQSGTDISGFTQRNLPQMQQLFGTGIGGANSLASLRAQLDSSGASLHLNGLNSMPALVAQLSAKKGTLDGKAVLTGMSWADQLASLHMTGAAAPVGGDAMMFGLFYNQSLSSLIANHPDVFASVGSGLGSPAAQAAWASAMANAGAATSMDLSKLPEPCLVGMFSAMGGGSSGSGTGACGACQVGGSYISNAMSKIFNPSQNSVIPTVGGGVSASQWSQEQGWLQNGTVNQNPSLSQSLNASFGGGGLGSCTSSSAATSGALTSTLPGVFGNLGK